MKKIINLGSKVKAAINAITIARPVNKPNKTLGMKFDMDRIEKPIVIVIEV